MSMTDGCDQKRVASKLIQTKKKTANTTVAKLTMATKLVKCAPSGHDCATSDYIFRWSIVIVHIRLHKFLN